MEIITLLLAFSEKIGYGGIILLMAIESSFIPFPSEIVVPPAAYLASIGKMNLWLVIFSAISGSLIGASLNYFLALTLGRKLVYYLAAHRVSSLLLINERKVKKSEEYFLKYGRISTFIGRLVPAVRQLISIPAGFSKMNFKEFLFYTFLGSGIWTVILAFFGYIFGANKEVLNKNLLFLKLGILIIVLIGAAFFMFYILKKKKRYKKDL